MNIALWIVQVLLGIAFIMSGGMKLAVPVEELAKQGGAGAEWMLQMAWLVKFIGISEVAGGLGVILPAATHIKPMLTPLAAVGLVVIMVLATGFHAMRGEFSHIPPTLILGAIAAFVAWGRTQKVPIAPR